MRSFNNLMKNIVDDIRQGRRRAMKIIRIHLCVWPSAAATTWVKGKKRASEREREIVMADLETLNFITHFFRARCVEPSL
jgi:hypothetical protein